MPENQIDYYPNAKWAVLNGCFTPEDLRNIAKEIEDRNNGSKK